MSGQSHGRSGEGGERTLRDDLREHYESRHLPAARLERLKAMARDPEPRKPAGPAEGPGSRALLALAALALVAVGFVVVRAWLSLPSADGTRLASAIAEEIAMNHNKGLGVEYETESYAELRQQMDKLDFSLVEASHLETRGLRLVGARYCSIQGLLAAQLRLETAAGEALTLYQAPYAPELQEVPFGPQRAQGLVIELWQEDGVFLGLARAP